MQESGGPRQLVPWRVAALYLVLGVVWVLMGDLLLAHWVTDPDDLTRYQTWKGWLYVLLTGVLAGWLAHRAREAE